MLSKARIAVLSLIILIGTQFGAIAQITSPAAAYTQPTQYTNGMPDDEIFVFCSPDVNGNVVTGSLTATPTIAGPGFTFDWGVYDDVTHTYTPFFTQNGASSSVNNLASGGYNVTITNNAGQTQTFVTWVYVSQVAVDVSLALDPVHPGCEPFDVNGTINATGFTYWDPVEPGNQPFLVDANTEITICFSANHTYVSDLGFTLVGPPGCGSPGVTIYPNPQAVNAANGCCCNSGNNVNNLCFSTNNSNQLNMCTAGVPLSGTYAFYNGNFPGGNPGYPVGGLPNIYGCNAAEGGWALQIYDCIGADVGALTSASITFSNGTSTLVYSSGAINSTINDNSCTAGTASIYVIPLTTPVDPPVPQQVPNSGTLTYQLGVNGVPVSLAQGTNSFTQNVDPIPTYDEWYYLFIQDQLGCSAIDSALFDFTGYADASINPINSTNQLCTGNQPVQITTVNPGGTWSGTGVNATGMFDPAAAGVGTHTITYSFADPCGDVQTMDIIVGDLTANTSSTPSVCTADNGTATFTPLTGAAPYTYSWVTVPVQTTQTATGLAPGNYDVTVDDNDGCSLTTTVVVGFDPSNLAVSIPNSTDALCNAACDGTATAVAIGGTSPYQYVWDDPAFQQSALATGLCANTYNVGVADANGCLATAQVVLTEPTAVNVAAVMDIQSNCGNPDGQVSAVGNGGTSALNYSYSWDSTPVQATAVATALVPGTYTVTATDDNGCTATASATVTSTPGFSAAITGSTDASCFAGCNGSASVQAGAGSVAPLSYTWNSVPVQNTANATNLCAGTYLATITDDVGCIATASVTISEPLKTTATVAASASPICVGESSNLSSTIAGGTTPYAGYFWTSVPNDPTLVAATQNPTVSPVITTAYTFVGTDANGCSTDPVNVTVVVRDLLSLDVIRPTFNPDTGICPYDFAVIDLLATGGDGNYTFYLAPDNINPITLPMQVQPTSTTTYDFTVRDGCTTPPAFATSTITVFVLPVVDFVTADLSGCHPHDAQFIDQTNPMPTSWNWNFGDPNSGANTSTVQNPTHDFSGFGLYDISLSVGTADGCVNDTVKSAYVEVFPLPYANFELDPERTNVLSATINFTDLSSGDIANWHWNFGTGDTSGLQHPVYNYTDTGIYTIWLQVTTVDGCLDDAVRLVEIDPDVMFYIPNAFSPNDDGRNDYFRGYGEGVKWDTYELFVYNRWGEEIFYTADIENPWRGWFKDKEAPNDVYVWMIRIYDQNGDLHTYRGHVSLVR